MARLADEELVNAAIDIMLDKRTSRESRLRIMTALASRSVTSSDLYEERPIMRHIRKVVREIDEGRHLPPAYVVKKIDL